MDYEKTTAIPEELYAAFVGKNAESYLPTFRAFMEGKSIISMNFWAIFFGPGWFLYRKVTLIGVICLIFHLLIDSEFLFFYLGFSKGFDLGFALTKKMVFMGHAALSISVGLFANYFYFLLAKKRLTSITQNESIKDKEAAAQAEGGTSMGALFVCMCVMILMQLHGIL